MHSASSAVRKAGRAGSSRSFDFIQLPQRLIGGEHVNLFAFHVLPWKGAAMGLVEAQAGEQGEGGRGGLGQRWGGICAR